MADAILHAQYAPSDGRGGTCASGEFIIGASSGGVYPNRFTVFDPVSRTSKVYSVSLPFSWSRSSFGVPFDGGVALCASTTSSTGPTYLLILYPDGTYSVHSVGVSWGYNANLAVVGSSIWIVRSSTNTNARIFNGGTFTSTTSSVPQMSTTSVVSGGLIWYGSASTVIGLSPSTATADVTHSASLSGQIVLLGDRLWSQTGSSNLRGVRLSDGDVVNHSTPTATIGVIAAGDGKLWITASSSGGSVSGYAVDPDTGDVTTYPHPLSIGAVSQMFYGNGRAWAMGASPIS